MCTQHITPFKYICWVQKLTQSCYFLKSRLLCHGPMRWAPASCCMAHQGPTPLRVPLETLSLLHSSCFGAAVSDCSPSLLFFESGFVYASSSCSGSWGWSFISSPLSKPCKFGILLWRERWELLLLSYTMTTQKTAEKGRMGEVSLIKRKICDYIEDYLQVLPMWCLLASSCPFTFLAIFTFSFGYVRLSLSNWNFSQFQNCYRNSLWRPSDTHCMLTNSSFNLCCGAFS